ncbi:hypothetical protein [Mariniradius sediminis]|uniref:Uncharacterized protein n=1 Tax=Mariniradius sediminis TaxID=2909237 RepID=A0ABS9BUY8_9BACT|nr:hypothetical protein [Mariniradius sediminis]MCF1751441.1 hypothetical protein [Mariniradius sediminis]
MKNQNDYSFNSGIRFMTFALAMFFAVLAVFDEYKDQGSLERYEELVSEKEYDFAIFPSSLSRPTSSKLTKIERMEVVKIVDRIFSIQLINPQVALLAQPREILIPHFISLFSKFDILTNAP